MTAIQQAVRAATDAMYANRVITALDIREQFGIGVEDAKRALAAAAKAKAAADAKARSLPRGAEIARERR